MVIVWSLLVVDSQQECREYLTRVIRRHGYEVQEASDWNEARDRIEKRRERADLICIEPLSQGTWLSQHLREACLTQIPVIVISARRDSRYIVEAIRLGAQGYLPKPFTPEQLKQVVSEILALPPKRAVRKTPSEGLEFIHSHPQMKEIHEVVRRVAAKPVPVLIGGESGVGKEVIARLLHSYSHVRQGPFVKVNCAALPEELVESELFGHTKGAFTGAVQHRPGKFQFAHNGTIFLDEIGELSTSVQAKLLQVLQDQSFTQLGSNEEVRINVRVIAATNVNLAEAMEEGRFRRDLFYRLNVVYITIPPLRERKEEIPLLCAHFLDLYSRQYNLARRELPEKLMNLFQNYHWPGNVRELANTIKGYLALGDVDLIRNQLARRKPDDIDDIVGDYLEGAEESLDLPELKKKVAATVEKTLILRTLRKTHWNKSKAAKELKVSYKTLLSKITEYDIHP